MNCLLYGFFFASGFSALVYEVAWIRILSVDFGSTVYAVSTVFSVFMTGLALGGFVFGRWIDRQTRPLGIYATMELLLGAYAVLFVMLMPYRHEATLWLLRGSFLPRELSGIVRFLLASAILIPPATLMGGTLPVLAKVVVKSPKSIGLGLGLLYGLNTLGAVLGCLGEAFLLIPSLGVNGSILLAALVNGLVGAGSMFVATRGREWIPVPAEEHPNPHEITRAGSEPPSAFPAMLLLHVIAFGSGFATLACEVLWTRLFVNFLTGNVLIVATLLGGFLAGIGVGSLIVARFVDRVRRWDVVVGITLLVNSFCMAASVFGQLALSKVFGEIHKLHPMLSQPDRAYLCLATLFAAAAIPATSFGAVLPLVIRWASRSLSTLGDSVGRIYASNTLGAILGSVLAGFVLIRSLGVNGSLLLLGAFYAVLSVLVVGRARLRLVPLTMAIALAVCVLLPKMRQPVYWFNGGFTGLERIPAGEILFLEEGVEATVGVSRREDVLSLTVNGLVVAESTRQDLWDLLLKAHLPMLLHPAPRDVALVGLGAGVSLGAVECYDVKHIDCIEISSAVVSAHRFFEKYNNRCWEDPRLKLWIEDGRHYLLTTDRRYDVISVDPVDPPVCNLYTQDFFQLCHDRLQSGGLMVQWVPLFRLSTEHIRVIMKSFRNVFDEATLWYDGTSVLLIGCRDAPLRVNVQQFVERANSDRVLASLAQIGRPSAWLLLSTYVTGIRDAGPLFPDKIPDNTDNFPFLEYGLLFADDTSSASLMANLEMLLKNSEPIDSRIIPADESENLLSTIREGQQLMRALLDVRIQALRGKFREAEDRLKEAAERFHLQKADVEFLAPFWNI